MRERGSDRGWMPSPEYEKFWREDISKSREKELQTYIETAEAELKDPDWVEPNRSQAEWQVQIAKEELARRTLANTKKRK